MTTEAQEELRRRGKAGCRRHQGPCSVHESSIVLFLQLPRMGFWTAESEVPVRHVRGSWDSNQLWCLSWAHSVLCSHQFLCPVP